MTSRRILGGIEQQLDVVLRRGPGNQANRFGRRRYVKQVAFAGQRGRKLLNGRHGDFGEKLLVLTRGLVGPRSPRRRILFCQFDGGANAPPQFGDFNSHRSSLHYFLATWIAIRPPRTGIQSADVNPSSRIIRATVGAPG